MTEQHVPVERLAAYAAGDVDATAAVEVEAHVALCAGCRSDVDAVRRATAALAELPPAGPMPADVAARVDAAVARAGSEAAGPLGDVLPMVPRKRSRPSFAGIAAVAACLALVGAITVPLVSGGGDADRGPGGLAASAPDRAVETKRVSSGLNYTSKTVAATLARAAGAPADATAFRDTAASEVAQPNSAPREDAGSAAPATGTTGGRSYAGGAPPAVGLSSLRQDAGRLGACIASLAASQPKGLGTTPLLVDFARFSGDPALVVVFPTVSRGAVTPDRVDVWIVGPGCGVTAGNDDVLVFERIARPAGL